MPSLWINLLVSVFWKGDFCCIEQVEMIHVSTQGTPHLDDTTDLNSGSVQYHRVKQDIIMICYLRKFLKTFTFLFYFNLFKVCKKKCKHVIVCKDPGTTQTPTSSYKYYLLFILLMYCNKIEISLNFKYLKTIFVPLRTNIV